MTSAFLIAYFKTNLGTTLKNNLYIGIPVMGLGPLVIMYATWQYGFYSLDSKLEKNGVYSKY